MITISTKDDIKDAVVNRVVQWAKKKCSNAHIVVEHAPGGRRHLHAAVDVTEAAEGNDIIGYLWRIVKEHHPDSQRRHAMNKHVMYDHRWYEQYLKKDEHVEVVYSKYDKAEVESHFPSAATQDALMEHVVQATADTQSVADPFIDKLCIDWGEYESEDASFDSAIKFLKHSMYVARTMRCIQDPRRMGQLANTMWHYRNKRVVVDAKDREHCTRGSWEPF